MQATRCQRSVCRESARACACERKRERERREVSLLLMQASTCSMSVCRERENEIYKESTSE